MRVGLGFETEDLKWCASSMERELAMRLEFRFVQSKICVCNNLVRLYDIITVINSHH